MTPQSQGAIQRQLNAFAAGGAAEFDVGALDHASGIMSNRWRWTRSQIHRSLKWIGKRNITGSSIYVRPSRYLAAHRWILIDDLHADTLAAVRTDIGAAIVVETSPGLYQAWTRAPEDLDTDSRTAIARALALRYGADLGGVGGVQYGRLAGTTNRKPERLRPDGTAVFAQLRHAGTEIARSLPAVETLPHAAAPAPATTDHDGATDEPWHHAQRGDRSRRDFAVACRLVRQQHDDDAIARTIRALRADDPRGKGARADYIERTIAAARAEVARGTDP